MKQVEFHPQAQRELEQSVNFYNRRVPGLGDEFLDLVVAATKRIQSDPLRCPLRPHGIRRMILDRFPFSVVYKDEPSRIWIVAFAHGARKPGYWSARL